MHRALKLLTMKLYITSQVSTPSVRILDAELETKAVIRKIWPQDV